MPPTVQLDVPRLKAQQERLKARERFSKARVAERSYAAQLKQVARQIGELIKGFAPTGTLEDFLQLRNALQRYGEILTPWARRVAAVMLDEVARRDATAWQQYGRTMGRELAKEIRFAPTGETLRRLMSEQVSLITSLPHSAAERVHKLTINGISNGTRAQEVAEEILQTGRVTRSRAMTIARTEVARTTTLLTRARAEYVGSEMFVWRTSLDADVRPSHRRLEGKIFNWSDPPVTELSGERALPGAIWNCRCYPEPILT